MSATLELIALSGPREGERIALPTSGVLVVGRAERGLSLSDPLVSVEHAHIELVADRFFVTDCESASGTFLNEVKLGKHAKALFPGSILRIGESEFAVEARVERSVWPLVAIAGLSVAAIVTVGLSLWAWMPIRYRLDVPSPPIRLASGDVLTAMPLPPAYLAETGWDGRATQVTRVSDYDQDGVDEVWLQNPDGRRVYTSSANGAWRVLGDFPKGCLERPGWKFPDQRCDGVIYRHGPQGYTVSEQEGAVVWADAGEGPRPLRVSTANSQSLGGFLADRGVFEPIHYLLCEEALPGLPAQVLTAGGRVEALSYGCLGDLGLEGEGVSGKVRAVALSHTGYEAMMRDLRHFLSGDSLGAFLSPERSEVWERWHQPPKRAAGNARLRVHGGDFFAFEAFETQDTAVHPWYFGDAGWAAQPPSRTRIAAADQPLALPTEGCAVLKTEIAPPHCLLRRWCFPARTYLTLWEEGCGDRRALGTVSYRGGKFAFAGEHLEVAGWVDSATSQGRIDVIRTRLSYRKIAKKAQ